MCTHEHVVLCNQHTHKHSHAYTYHVLRYSGISSENLGVGILRYLYLPFSTDAKLLEHVTNVTYMTRYPVTQRYSKSDQDPERVSSVTIPAHATRTGA